MRLSSRLPWYCLLATAVLVPLVVGVVPFSGVQWTLNVFVEARLIVFCLAIGAGLAAWAFVSLRSGSLPAGRALVPLGVLSLVAIVSGALALDPRIAFFGDFEQGVGVLVVLLCAVACLLTAQLVRDQRRLRTLTHAVVYTATAIAVIGVAQQLFALDVLGINNPTLPEYFIRRGYATIGNADTYAAFLVLPAVLAFSLLRRAATRADLVKWGASFLVILISEVATQTRGPFLALMVALVLYLVAERVIARSTAASGAKRETSAPNSRAAGLVVLAGIVAGVLVAAVFAQRMEAAVRRDFLARFGSIASLTSLGGRLPLWASALKIAARHPFFGVGPDSFRLGWYGVRDIPHLAQGAGLVITDPHSVPLLILATMGAAGLLAAAYFALDALIGAVRVLRGAATSRGVSAEYLAWFVGAVALLLTFLASLLTSVLLLMLFLALGVLIAPRLTAVSLAEMPRAAVVALRATAIAIAVALLAFALVATPAQMLAAEAKRAGDADDAASVAARAASIAPWDTAIRLLKYETQVQAALSHVFTNQTDAAAVVKTAEDALARARRTEPHEYMYPYRSAVLLIGSGQQLGDTYTQPGIDAGLAGLKIYPYSLELRTGIATGYLQLAEPAKAKAILADVWDADPAYIQSGIVYVGALVALGENAEARSAVNVLRARFPGDSRVSNLAETVPAE